MRAPAGATRRCSPRAPPATSASRPVLPTSAASRTVGSIGQPAAAMRAAPRSNRPRTPGTSDSAAATSRAGAERRDRSADGDADESGDHGQGDGDRAADPTGSPPLSSPPVPARAFEARTRADGDLTQKKRRRAAGSGRRNYPMYASRMGMRVPARRSRRDPAQRCGRSR